MSAKTTDQPVTDDQELAKVLANNTTQQKAAAADALSGLEFEEPPVPSGQTSTPSAPPVITPSPSASSAAKTPDLVSSTPTPSTPAVDPVALPSSPMTSPAPSGSLEELKKDALEELRPLVDKLNLPADEKFDTLLLIIRSTDDQSLLGAAHDAAKAITDDSRRAQALLDVIKEIDYFSGQSAAQ